LKFKAQVKQNQLLERISTQHLVVGIGIAQQSHVALAVNFRGITLGTPLHFSNDDAGFCQLLQWMKDMQDTHQLNDTIIGMEPTGHYWLKDRSLEVVLVNPHLVKKNKENRDNTPSKSDIKDALVIADMVKNGYYTVIKETSEVYMELRVLMANRETIVHRLVSVKNQIQIHRWVDIVFPELRQVYKHLIGSGSLATLRLFPTPADLQKLTVRQVIDGWKTVMRRHSGERRAGDLSGYVHGNALLRHAGLNLAEASSGKWKGQMSISKRGRPRLRHALFMATMAQSGEAYEPDRTLPMKQVV